MAREKVLNWQASLAKVCLNAAAGLLAFSAVLAIGDAFTGAAHRANPMFAWLLMNLAGDPRFWTAEEFRALMQRDAWAAWMVLWPTMRFSLSALCGLLAAWVLGPRSVKRCVAGRRRQQVSEASGHPRH